MASAVPAPVEVFVWDEEAVVYLASHMATTAVAKMARHLETSVPEVSAQLAAMGFAKRGKLITTDAILERLRAFKAIRGSYPRVGTCGWQADDKTLARGLGIPDNSTVRRRFGNMSKALAAAEGVPLELANVRAKKISRETALDLLNIYKHLAGHYPQARSQLHGPTVWNDNGLADRLTLPKPCRYITWFGRLSESRQQADPRPLDTDLLAALHVDEDTVAGLSRGPMRASGPQVNRDVRRGDLLTSLQAYYFENGAFPSITKGNVWLHPTKAKGVGLRVPSQYLRYFGGIGHARQAAAEEIGVELAIEPSTYTRGGVTTPLKRKVNVVIRKPNKNAKPKPAAIAVTEVTLNLQAR